MFIELTVENFRSIADRQTLSFVAGKHRSEAAGAPAVDEPGFAAGKVLTSTVIYGANGSGKSNVVRALNEMMVLVVRSATPGTLSAEPFRLDADREKMPTRFELTFVKDGVRYQYGFSFTSERIDEEWLIAYPKKTHQVWFERRPSTEKVEIHFGPSLRGEKARLATMTRPDALFLSVAAQFNNPQLAEIHAWLTSSLTAQRSSHFDPLDTAGLVDTGDRGRRVVGQALRGADIGIEGVTVRRHAKMPDSTSGTKNVLRSAKKDEFLEILTEHRRSDGAPILFDLMMDESEGTARYFALLAPIFVALGRGGLLAIDELDQSLHPLLVRRIISLFHDPVANPKRAQLVFNTHDTTLLDPKLFRRDQIWFTEKDAAGKTRLYSLLDYSPRKSEALQRGYLEGRYGAIPFLDDLRFPVISDAEARRAG